MPAAASRSSSSRRRSTSISKSPACRPMRAASSGRDAPAEVLEGIRGRVPGREHRRPEPLEVAVDVAGDRPDVVGRDDAAPATIDTLQDEHDTEMAQLVVGQPDRAPPQRVEDLVERVGMDRRGQAVPDRRRSDRDPRGLAPGVGRGVVRQLVGEQDRGLAHGSGRGPPAVAPCRANPAPRPAAATRRSRSPRPARRRARTAAGSRAARRGGSTCPRPAPPPRPRPGPAPRPAARARRPARRRGCRCGSAPRPTAARAGSVGRPSGFGRARSRPWAERMSVVAHGQPRPTLDDSAPARLRHDNASTTRHAHPPRDSGDTWNPSS